MKEKKVVFACCEAKGHYENLKEVVSIFEGDVTKLSQAMRRNRCARLFLYMVIMLFCPVIWAVRGKRDTFLYVVYISCIRGTNTSTS